jgi:flagellar FliL protein
MSKAATANPAEAHADGKPAGSGKKKLLLLAVPVLLVGIVAGLWFSGVLPPLLGMGPESAGHEPAVTPHDAPKPPAHGAPQPATPLAHGAPKEDPHAAKPAAANPAGGKSPMFFELPDIIANLNSGSRRTVYVKVKPRLELARAEDEATVRAALPRLMDMFQTYLREIRPEELRGSAGMYRLREGLLARANVAVTPAKIIDVLFVEMLIQ